MSSINKEQARLVVVILGLILIVLWLIGKFIATGWLPNFYVDMFGAIGFLIMGYLGLAKANQQVGPKKDEEE